MGSYRKGYFFFKFMGVGYSNRLLPEHICRPGYQLRNIFFSRCGIGAAINYFLRLLFHFIRTPTGQLVAYGSKNNNI